MLAEKVYQSKSKQPWIGNIGIIWLNNCCALISPQQGTRCLCSHMPENENGLNLTGSIIEKSAVYRGLAGGRPGLPPVSLQQSLRPQVSETMYFDSLLLCLDTPSMVCTLKGSPNKERKELCSYIPVWLWLKARSFVQLHVRNSIWFCTLKTN